jgi:hypothetical protein
MGISHSADPDENDQNNTMVKESEVTNDIDRGNNNVISDHRQQQQEQQEYEDDETTEEEEEEEHRDHQQQQQQQLQPVFASVIADGARNHYNDSYSYADIDFGSNEEEEEVNSFLRRLGLVNTTREGAASAFATDQSSSTTNIVAADVGDIIISEEPDFTPHPSRHYEWMGRSLETLISGFAIVPPILEIPSRVINDVNDDLPGGDEVSKTQFRRWTSVERLNDLTSTHRRRQKLRRNLPISSARSVESESQRRCGGGGGPNVSLSLLARETTGRLKSRNDNDIAASDRLKSMGGTSLFNALDEPASGMCSEVTLLEEAIDNGDWAGTQIIISRISPRLIGDPTAFLHLGGRGGRDVMNDPSLHPTAHRFYAGGGRLGLERDAFVLAGGISVLVRIFRESSFVGECMASSYDTRDLSKELFVNRLGHCWNEALACLRELIYSIPSLVEKEHILNDDNQEFLTFLFTLMSHDACFDGAATVIEEILSLQSNSSQQQQQPAYNNINDDEMDNNEHDNNNSNSNNNTTGASIPSRVSNPTIYFLGNVSNLYTLWGNFSCRQLAHFCRILALLIFEPEDRQLLESPAVLKSIELLQLRRNRAARAGRDSTVNMNQSILLGDEILIKRLLQLLAIMNFGPPLSKSSSFHVMAHFPFIADTLMMMGLKEFGDWSDVDRLDKIARKLLISTSSIENNENNINSNDNDIPRQLHDLGSVTEMLENLSSSFSNGGEPTNQLGHVIAVISAAQQAGVVAGRARTRETNRNETNDIEDIPRSELDDLASAAGILSDQVHRRRDSFKAPEDAANMLQFNALLLGPYQVEILFVLCTLLGGRRKIDAQEMLKNNGIIRILDDMFQRLPWGSLSSSREPVSRRDSENRNGASESLNEQQAGIHGPGCECTPESALVVQYLRLLHNFCDRDCDNYDCRRLLLSDAERTFLFGDHDTFEYDTANLPPGLLSKIVAAFVSESDESPYRFWLASCIESFLRGSSSVEQVFVAKSGLIEHLIADVTRDSFHCSGSLQTSFDLLGELCKGNTEALEILVSYLENEDKFRKLMIGAASNLVDSNVFIRSVILSLEIISLGNQSDDNNDMLSMSNRRWKSDNGVFSRAYLTHSWWDMCLINESNNDSDSARVGGELLRDRIRPSDWFPTMKTIDVDMNKNQDTTEAESDDFLESSGHFGWIFKPEDDTLPSITHGPNTIERLSWFLSVNRTRLLRDLLKVVNLKNINHENICCLNTAVCITIFAYRRQELHILLRDLKLMSDEELKHERQVDDAARMEHLAFHSSFLQAMKEMNIDRRSSSTTQRSNNKERDTMQNFREVLWFWIEYYTHRGRDRLSLEFSSRLRFSEWIEVVTLLTRDDSAPTSLVMRPLPLPPRSPYQRFD